MVAAFMYQEYCFLDWRTAKKLHAKYIFTQLTVLAYLKRM